MKERFQMNALTDGGPIISVKLVKIKNREIHNSVSFIATEERMPSV